MNWLSRWMTTGGAGRRRASPFNNLGPQGLTCGYVTEHLLVGGELGPNDWRALEKEGVSVVINLQQEQQDVFGAHEHLDSSLWLPAPDGLAPTVEQLSLGVEVIHAAAQADKRVFVHCKAGQGRAPLLCACYLIRSENLKPLEAIGRVREARARTQLTPEQSVRLREYAAALKTMRATSGELLTPAISDTFASHQPVSQIVGSPQRNQAREISPQAGELSASAKSHTRSIPTEPEIMGPISARLKARGVSVESQNGAHSPQRIVGSAARETDEHESKATTQDRAT